MQMTRELSALKKSVDELLLAHTEFDSALWSGDYENMTRAQKKIEAARCKTALASRRFEDTLEDYQRLHALMSEEEAGELARKINF